MSLMNILYATLVVLILGAVLALVIGVRSVEAGVLETPVGGWGVERPLPAPGVGGPTRQVGPVAAR